MTTHFLAELLIEKPLTWGLRGDPFFWEELKQRAETIKLPDTKIELEKLLRDLFKELTEQELEYGKDIHVERYKNIGMSSGWVCSDYWIDTGFPLIIQRFEQQILG